VQEDEAGNKIPSKPPAAAPATPEAIADPPSSIELHHSRRKDRRAGWLRVAVPVAGLLIVPTVGLLYAATTSFDPSAETAAEGETGDTSATSKGGKKKLPKGMKSSPKPRSDGAADCCAKLHDLGRTAPVDQRAAYLSAAQACDAAPDEDKAMQAAKSTVKSSRQDLPPECEN
jgi:hypothetical protein